MDDNDAANAGTNNSAILQGIVDYYCRESVVYDGLQSLAKINAYVIVLPVTRSGNQRIKLETPVTVPGNKCVVFMFDVYRSGAVDVVSGDYGFVFQATRQGAATGIRNMVMNGAGIQIRGSANGHGITAQYVQGIRCREAVINLVDERDVDEESNLYNVTQYQMSQIENYLSKFQILMMMISVLHR